MVYVYIYMIIYVCNNIYIVGSIFVRTNGSVRFLADGRSLGQDADLYSEHLVHNHHRTALRLGVSMVFRGTGEALSKVFFEGGIVDSDLIKIFFMINYSEVE